MIGDFSQDLRLLKKADSLIGKIWLKVMARRFGLFAYAGLIAVFGLAMSNVAGFYTLQPFVGPAWAATIVAIADSVQAAIVILVARNFEPGPEIELADVRKIAIESLQADARDLKVTVDALGQEIRDAKDIIVGFIHNPLDAAAQNVLVPAAISIINGLRSKKDEV
jgi:hypothetical protein